LGGKVIRSTKTFINLQFFYKSFIKHLKCIEHFFKVRVFQRTRLYFWTLKSRLYVFYYVILCSSIWWFFKENLLILTCILKWEIQNWTFLKAFFVKSTCQVKKVKDRDRGERFLLVSLIIGKSEGSFPLCFRKMSTEP